MKICVITGVPSAYAPKRIIEEGIRLGHKMHLANWEDIKIIVNENGLRICDQAYDLGEFDAIIPRSDRYSIINENGGKIFRDMDTTFKLLVQYAKSKGVFFLNAGYFQEYQSMNKLAQQFFFRANGIPGIDTFFYPSREDAVKSTTVFPVIGKTLNGSRGAGVYKLNNKVELKKFLKNNQNYLIQRYYPIDCDYRVLVVGEKVLGIMRRSGQGDEWRTNVSLGGRFEQAEDNKEMKALAIKIAKKGKFDYVGVDILKYDGELHVIETNSLPQFEGFEKAFANINVAKILIEYVTSVINSENKTSK